VEKSQILSVLSGTKEQRLPLSLTFQKFVAVLDNTLLVYFS